MIESLNYYDIQENPLNLLEDIFNDIKAGIVIRNFFTPEELDLITKAHTTLESEMYKPFESYKAIPRPFDHIDYDSINEYYKEIDLVSKQSTYLDLKNLFFSKFKSLESTLNLIPTSQNNNYSQSKSWYSFRKLMPYTGEFEIHCGNLFLNWNEFFFQHQKKTCSIHKHLAFLLMVQQPDSTSDIEIYNAHWSEINQKTGKETLRKTDGTDVVINDIERDAIKLAPGDMLIFDESNYWHKVPAFKGDKERITFGGFISKFNEQNAALFWA